MTTSITVSAICTNVVSQASGRLERLLTGHCGTGMRHLPAAAALHRAAARDGRSRMALMAFTNMLETASSATGMEHLGLQMAGLPHAQDSGLLRRLSAHAPTVGQALEDMVRFFPSVQTGTAVTLARQGPEAVLSYRILDQSIGRSLQDAAFTMGRLHKHLHEAAGNAWRIEEVALRGEAPRNACLYREFFQGPVRFGAATTALRFPVSVLAVPIVTADAGRYAQVCDHLAQRLQAADEAALLEDALGAWILHAPRRSGSVGLEEAASDFGISVRTLQRRLQALGINFSALRARVRMEAACRWLADSALPVSHIGEELGFSETSAFTRAFTSYKQQSPRAFRRALLAA